MAKDRFSRFKKSNYDYTFRYGTDEIIDYKEYDRKRKLQYEKWNDLPDNKKKKKEIKLSLKAGLTIQQRDYILNLIKQTTTNDWEKKFLRSLLVCDKALSQKQKEIVKRIKIKNVKNNG